MKTEIVLKIEEFKNSLNHKPAFCPRCKTKAKRFKGWCSDRLIKNCDKCGTQYEIWDDNLIRKEWNRLNNV